MPSRQMDHGDNHTDRMHIATGKLYSKRLFNQPSVKHGLDWTEFFTSLKFVAYFKYITMNCKK